MKDSQTTLRHPKCETKDKCRIQSFGGTTTLMGWTPMFDGDGNPLNRDPNTTRSEYACSGCGLKWTKVTCLGESHYEYHQ